MTEDTRELSSTFVDGSVKTVIIPGGDPVEGTWAKLNELKENEELIPGDTYILTDYQTKYIIEGTDTEDSESLLPVIGTASGYAQFYCINSEILNASNALGTELTIKAIPSSYTGPLTVGQTVTIDAFLIVAMLGFPLELLPQESF